MPEHVVSEEEKVKHLAEAEKFKAEARKATAEAIKFEADAAIAIIQKNKTERAEREELAGDKFNHIYYFTDAVGSSSIKQCINQLTLWNRLEPKCGIEINFNSPGGSVIDGMVLFDFIQGMKRKGHHIITSTLGMAASMAGILLQAGDTRVVHKEAWLLIHEVSFGASGSMGAVEDTVDWAKRIQERVLNIFAERCKLAGESGTAKHPLNKTQLKKRWSRKDWWISSENALDWGLIDEIR